MQKEVVCLSQPDSLSTYRFQIVRFQFNSNANRGASVVCGWHISSTELTEPLCENCIL